MNKLTVAAVAVVVAVSGLVGAGGASATPVVVAAPCCKAI